jgi:hypothetical protein
MNDKQSGGKAGKFTRSVFMWKNVKKMCSYGVAVNRTVTFMEGRSSVRLLMRVLYMEIIRSKKKSGE